MTLTDNRFRGPLLAITAAVLFGLSSPLAKILLVRVDPTLLAGLLYLGSGIGLTLWQKLKGAAYSQSLRGRELAYLVGAIVAGGVLAPVLLMTGLSLTTAASASLLLNMEGVFSAVLAWIVFKENCDRRIVLGMLAITAGAVLLSGFSFELRWGNIFVLAACLGWALDNNWTRKISDQDPLKIATSKGLVSGLLNCGMAVIALSIKHKSGLLSALSSQPIDVIALSMLIGFLSYGVSLVLYIHSLRHLGAARTSAYFCLAPFIGALAAVLWLHETITGNLIASALLMGFGVLLHLTESHEHTHTHEPLEHCHEHFHDEHHKHEHTGEEQQTEPHTHWHRHEAITHRHPHFPDIHHQHSH
jgi:drug/metabolite transporter (DMT)-like permease